MYIHVHVHVYMILLIMIIILLVVITHSTIIHMITLLPMQLVVIHMLMIHSDAYANALNARSEARTRIEDTDAHDQRGQGQSPGRTSVIIFNGGGV